LTDIGFNLWFFSGYGYKNLLDGFGYWIDQDFNDIGLSLYQSTSDTKVVRWEKLVNGDFAHLFSSGNYRVHRTLSNMSLAKIRVWNS